MMPSSRSIAAAIATAFLSANATATLGQSTTELMTALADLTEDGFAEVQTAIRANELLEAAFDEEKIDVAQAIAITGKEGGDLVVYLDEPTVQR
jgi:hypothetical protein